MMPYRTTTKPRVMIFATLLALCGALNGTTLIWLLWRRPFLNADFMAFWSFPRFAATQPLAQMYNATAVQKFQQALYPGFHSFYPFTYPPDFLLVCTWLRDFSYANAELIWTLAGLAVMAAAALHLFANHRPWLCTAVLLASPATLMNLVLGQTAFFTTGLLLGGLAMLPKRPLLAGFAFGLLTFKPQLGLLLPFLLLARGEWRTIIAASLTTAVLVALSCALWPVDLWRLWAASLPAYQLDYFGGGANLSIMVTPAANLLRLSLPGPAAFAVQSLCTLAAAALVFLAARRAPLPLAAAALLAGSFLAIPHAYAYDTIPLTAAMALCITARTPPWQLALFALTYLAPLALFSPASSWFFYALPETILFACIIALALRAPKGAIFAHEPNLFPEF